MKIARYRYGDEAAVAYGVLEGDEVADLKGTPFGEIRRSGARRPLAEVTLLAPADPREMWGPGLNFANHLEFAAGVLGDADPHIPEHPEPWVKARNALAATGDHIILPYDAAGEIHYEGEAVAVIGQPCRRVSPQEAGRYIFGYTCGNDVSERAWQKDDWTFWRAKGSDTFAPVGPWIATEVDPQALEMIVRLNGEEVQHGRTEEMLFTFAEIVSYISQQITLQPGDLIFSGSTGVTTALKDGDVVEVEIPGIGTLTNPVILEPRPA